MIALLGATGYTGKLIAAIVPALVARTAGSVMPLVERLRPRILPLVERLPEGPSQRVRQRGRVRVMAQASGPTGQAAVLTECRDPYGLTARLIVEATQRLRGTGAMAPAEALDPEPFFQAVSGDAFTWRRVACPPQTAPTRASMNDR